MKPLKKMHELQSKIDRTEQNIVADRRIIKRFLKDTLGQNEHLFGWLFLGTGLIAGLVASTQTVSIKKLGLKALKFKIIQFVTP